MCLCGVLWAASAWAAPWHGRWHNRYAHQAEPAAAPAPVVAPTPTPSPQSKGMIIRARRHARAGIAASPIPTPAALPTPTATSSPPPATADAALPVGAEDASSTGLFGVPSPASVIALVAQSRESYLISHWPKESWNLPMYWWAYSWNMLHMAPITDVHPVLTLSQQRDLTQTLVQWDQLTADIGDEALRALWHGDLFQVLARSGNIAYWRDAQDEYLRALALTEDSHIAKVASYHAGLTMLALHDHFGAIMLAHRQSYRWSTDAEWITYFRSIAMESYFLRGRYIRAEEYLWDLARDRMSRDDMTPHLALRYGDSLFWQKRFPEAVTWYEQNLRLLNDPQSESNPAIVMSWLYYAEALFQIGRTTDARQWYEQFQHQYRGKYSVQMMNLRLAETDAELGNATVPQLLPKIMAVISLDPLSPAGVAAQMFWIRAVAKENLKEFLEEARLKQRAIDALAIAGPQRFEVKLTGAMINWRLEEYAAAVDYLHRFFADFEPGLPEPIVVGASDFASLLLTHLAPLYAQRNHLEDFLGLCDMLSPAMEHSNFRLYPLVWVARSYIESGMVGAAARLYERLLLEVQLTPAQRDSLMLELSRSYARLEEATLAAKTLALISSTPTDAASLHTYRIVRATVAVMQKKYDQCLSEIDALLQSGIRGDELYPVAIQGARCGRLAEKFDVAAKFVGMVGEDNAKIQPDQLSERTKRWLGLAQWEKSSVLIASGRIDAGITQFEAAKRANFTPPPMEAVFLAVSAYRQLHQPDQAAELWKEFGTEPAGVSENFHEQYAQLLDLLSQAELLPPAPQAPAH